MSVSELLRRNRIIFAGVALLGSLTLAAPTGAATKTTTLGISATVAATCSVSTALLAFSAYTGVAATTAKLLIACTNNTPYTVGLSPESSTGATVVLRSMTGSDTLPKYLLTSDAVNTVNWTNTGTDTVTAIGNGVMQPMIVYGPLSAGQRIAPGAYIDTVTATVIW